MPDRRVNEQFFSPSFKRMLRCVALEGCDECVYNMYDKQRCGREIEICGSCAKDFRTDKTDVQFIYA